MTMPMLDQILTTIKLEPGAEYLLVYNRRHVMSAVMTKVAEHLSAQGIHIGIVGVYGNPADALRIVEMKR